MSIDTKAVRADTLLAYAPIPESSLGPAVNEQGYYVGRVERNLYWVTDGVYQCGFLTTPDGVVLFDAPATIGHNIQRAIDEIANANGVSNRVTHLIHSHHHADHLGASSLFDKAVRATTSPCTSSSLERSSRTFARSLPRSTPRSITRATGPTCGRRSPVTSTKWLVEPARRWRRSTPAESPPSTSTRSS